MILFCDTSALVKLYVRESFSDELRELAAQAQALAVVRIAWAEAIAALARKVREYPADCAVAETVRARLHIDWPSFAVVEVTQAVVELASDYAESFALLGYDSVQLAAARIVQDSATESVFFSCFDKRLEKAAKVLGLTVLNG